MTNELETAESNGNKPYEFGVHNFTDKTNAGRKAVPSWFRLEVEIHQQKWYVHPRVIRSRILS